jgi:CRP/FNR family transcriptional regulator, dissimilatory nitrate respiration regulator
MDHLSLSLSQIVDIMRRMPYFQELAIEELRALARGAREFAVPKKGFICRKGDRASALYTVVSGRVKLFLPSANGSEKLVGLMGPGQSFGEIPVFLGEPCPESAQAVSDSYILAVDRELILPTIDGNALARKMLAGLSCRMRDLLQDVEACQIRSSVQRVACFLLRQSPSGDAQSYVVELPARKGDIATLLNIAAATLSRVLRRLCDEGIVKVRGRTLEVLDRTALEGLNPHISR